MRNRVLIALFLAVLLVGTASFMRISGSNTPKVELVSSTENDVLEIYNDEAFWPTATSSNSVNTQPTTHTGIVSRQILTDYITLATQGQVSADTLNSLTQKYIESVPALSSANTVGISSLKIVSDTRVNLTAYEDSMNLIHESFAKKLTAAYGSSDKITSSSPNVYPIAKTIGQAYQEAANSLKLINVPSSVSFAHLKLVNNYLSNASAMNSVSNLETDPIVAFAGISAMKKNFDASNALLTEISQILIKQGI